MAGNEGAPKEKDPTLEPVVILKPGYGEYQDSFLPIEESLASSGVRASTDEHPEVGPITELKEKAREAKDRARLLFKEQYPGRIDDQILEDLLESIPLSLFRETLSVIEHVEKKGTGSQNIILAGHSQGAAAVSLAAFLRPDLPITKLILLNPAGLARKEKKTSEYWKASDEIRKERTGTLKDLFLSRAWRTTTLMTRYTFALVVSEGIGSLFRGKQFPRMLQAIGDSIEYIGERLLNREMFAETHGLANFDVLPYLSILHELKGITVDVVYDRDDFVFPSERIEAHIAHHQSSWIRLHPTDGLGHFGPVKDPRYFSELIHELINT